MHQRLVLAVLAVAVPGLAHAGATREEIDALIEAHARSQNIPASVVHRVVKRESNYNPHARGGSALGLMQIKHPTARGVGYRGDAGGLFDADTNLRYGVAYLAGAWRLAKGNYDQCYRYYQRGYYFAAKRSGIATEVAAVEPAPAPSATSAAGFFSLFGLRTGIPAAPTATASAMPAAGIAGTPAMAYAAAGATAQTVEVPLPPVRPASLGASAVAVAEAPATTPSLFAALVAPQAAVRATQPAQAETVEVPLPPRRPSAVALAAIARPAVARKPETAAPVMEAAVVLRTQ